MDVFEDRQHAGARLGAALREHEALRGERVVVLAIPRGGLPVAVEVAGALDAELDVCVVRKLRAPHNPELGYGAVGAGGHVEVDAGLAERLRLEQAEIDAEVADRREVVRRRLAMYRDHLPEVDLAGAVAVVVDDGIATGGTARRACAQARQAGAKRVVLAVPVAPRGAADRLADVADDVVVVTEPAEFLAVGQAYRDFPQLQDADVVELLRGRAAAR